MSKNNILIIALGAHGKGISGSDRIFIEFARRWSKNSNVRIVVNDEGHAMCVRQGLIKGVEYQVINLSHARRFGFIGYYFASILAGVLYSFQITRMDGWVIYSASEFWMDSIPSFIIRFRYQASKWVASWYQTAPSPLKGFSEKARKNKYRFKAMLYWLAQLPVKPIVVKYSDLMLVNNTEEEKLFVVKRKKESIAVVLGAVDTKKIADWKKLHTKRKKYDAVFQGRFHPQKGVVELVGVWKKVVAKLPDAKLVMIGNGPLFNQVKARIVKNNLHDNVKLTGYLFDGDEKYDVFNSCKLVVHPSLYDSGGMASAEAMAFGLPCVTYDLKAYKSYYPKGTVVARSESEFAQAIVKLLKDRKQRERIGKEAMNMVNKNFSWDTRSREIYARIAQL